MMRKKGILLALGVILLAGGLVLSCGDDELGDLTTAPTEQTAEAQAAAAQALAMAGQAQAMALALMGGGMGVGFAPQEPAIQPMARELELSNPNWCPTLFYVDIEPDGCDVATAGDCESFEIHTDYAEGCTEKGVYKAGDATLKLEALENDGFKVTAGFNDFIEGDLPAKDGSWSFSALPSDDKNSGTMRMETGSGGYSEGSESIEGYAELDFEANGPVENGEGTGDPATEAVLTVEADIEATGGSEEESIDVKYVIESDMTEHPGQPGQGITTMDISGTSSEWGRLTVGDEELQWKAEDLTLDPACNEPVGGSISVKGTDEEGVSFEATLTFHAECDGEAEISITVEGGDVSGTFTGTIALYLVAPPEDTILEELLSQFDQTFADIGEGLENLD